MEETDAELVLRVRRGERTEQETETEAGRYTVDGAKFTFLDDDGRPDKDWGIGGDDDIDDFDTGALAGDSTLTVKLQDGGRRWCFGGDAQPDQVRGLSVHRGG